jgi:hypothetical protein
MTIDRTGRIVRRAPSPYALAASPRFDAWFAAELTDLASDVAREVGDTFHALVLGGGYGRGEGGIVRRDGLERPYNDLDLFLFVLDPRRVPHERVERVARRHGKRLAVDVDISRPYRPGDVARWQPTLMWHDLLEGHHVLRGPGDVLTARCPRQVADPPPASEALRLLLNRGAGLLWARRVAHGIEPPPDDDFVRRNYYKCALGLGDALLIAHRAYGPTLASRAAALATLPVADQRSPAPDLVTRYREAVRFKTEPDGLPRAAPSLPAIDGLARAWQHVLLRVEALRTGRAWASIDAYVRWTGRRETAPASVSRVVGTLARNLKEGRVDWRHPREPLYRQLPALLTAATADTGWADASAAFLARWRAVQ